MYVNEEVRAMYGIPYSELTIEQKRILHEDSMRRARLIKETEKAVFRNEAKAFADEAKMEKVLASHYEDARKRILADVTETIAKVVKAGGTWSYANQSALTRSRGLFEQITAELTKLGQSEQATFYESLSRIYTDQFLRQIYGLGQSIVVNANFNRLNPALIKRTLDYPWSGAMFSDRIWTDKETLLRNLREGLTQSMILGEGIPQITARIKKGLDTSQYNAERLARTETKRVAYVAHNDAYEDIGVDRLKYYCAGAKSGSPVCDLCIADDGKEYERGKEPSLPRHPNCKCKYIPVVSDTFADNELNELTHSVRGAENYEAWLKANADKINPDGTLKDGWVRDWKNGGELVKRDSISQNNSGKSDNVSVTAGRDVAVGTQKTLASTENGVIIGSQGKAVVTPITDRAVERVPVVKIPGFTDEECTFIQQEHRELLKHAREYNDNKEVAFVFRKGLKDKSVFYGSNDEIVFGAELTGKGSGMVLLHNHPNNSSYSLKDISVFLKVDGIKTFTICKNSGAVEVLVKTDQFDAEAFLIDARRLAKEYVKKGTDDEYDRVVLKLLTKHSKEGGMVEWIR